MGRRRGLLLTGAVRKMALQPGYHLDSDNGQRVRRNGDVMTSKPVELEQLLENAFWLAPLARELTRASHDAEDALQDTWVVAAQKPPTHREASGSWLKTVLTRRVYQHQRESRRRKRRERRTARLESVPKDDDFVERLELQGLVADAVLELPSRYREAIVLRFYGDLAPSEIATRLAVSIHTVNTRLRRGLARLRERLDSQFGERQAWCLALAPFTLGSASQAGASASAVVTPSTLSSGVTVGLKSFGTIALMIILGIWVFYQTETAPKNSELARGPSQSAVTTEPDGVEVDLDRRAPSLADSEVLRDPAEVGLTESIPLRGMIRSGVDGRKIHPPLHGARIRVYPPQMTTLRAYVSDPNATPLTWQRFGKPQFPYRSQIRGYRGELVDPDKWIEVYDSARPYGEPLTETTSSEDGTFELPRPKSGCVVRVTHPDYTTGTEIVIEEDEELDMTLWKARSFSGTVIDADGNPILEKLDLAFHGNGATPVRCTTSPDGSFEVLVAAASIRVSCLTRGWSIKKRLVYRGGSRRPTRHTVTFQRDEPSPLFLIATRAPTLSVRSVDGVPILDFQLVIRQTRGDIVKARGRFATADGRVAFSDPGSGVLAGRRNSSPEPAELSIWAPGYEPAGVSLDSYPWEGELEVTLSPGDLPVLSGEVWNRHGIVVGARIDLVAFRDVAWNADESAVIGSTASDARGRFQLPAPDGRFLLRAQHGEKVDVRIVEIPSEASILVDFDDTGAIVVTVRNTEGETVPNHVVALGAMDGRRARMYTDEDGTARFEGLPSGDYFLMAPHVSTTDSFAADVRIDVSLPGTEEVAAELTVRAPQEPIYPTLVTEPAQPLEGWKARDSFRGHQVFDVEPNGTIPIDLLLGVKLLQVDSPSGQRWDFSIPDDPSRPYEVTARLSGVGYRGVLRSGSTPLAGVRVSAIPRRLDGEPVSRVAPAPSPSVVTDELGRFDLACSGGRLYQLLFNERAERATWGNHGTRLENASFEIDAPPSLGGAPIDIDVAPLLQATTRLRGRVLRATDHEPEAVAKAWVQVYSEFPTDAGTLRSSSLMGANDLGEYSMTVVVAPRYRAHYGEPDSEWNSVAWEHTALPPNGAKDFVSPKSSR